MPRRRHTPDQITRRLAQGQKLLAGGAELDAVCRHLEIAESTWHRWLAQYGGMKANAAPPWKRCGAGSGFPSAARLGSWVSLER